MNPYESPRDVEPLELEDTDFGPPHPSNRTMSIVIGIPGILFFVLGVLGLFGSLLDASISPHRGFVVTASIFIIGFVLPVIGLTMMWVSSFLWRYDSSQ